MERRTGPGSEARRPGARAGARPLCRRRLEARNGAPHESAQVARAPSGPAMKVCDGCREAKPTAAFEKYRRRCRDCRRRGRRTTRPPKPAEPGRPAAIAPAELLGRVEDNHTRGPHLIRPASPRAPCRADPGQAHRDCEDSRARRRTGMIAPPCGPSRSGLSGASCRRPRCRNRRRPAYGASPRS